MSRVQIVNAAAAPRRPEAEAPAAGPFRVVVRYTDAAETRELLEAAAALTSGFPSTIVLLAVQVLPYPAPFYWPESMREHLLHQLSSLAAGFDGHIEAAIVLARDAEEGFRQFLPSNSTVLMGSKSRWRWSREKRLAQALTRWGHSVTLVPLGRKGASHA